MAVTMTAAKVPARLGAPEQSDAWRRFLKSARPACFVALVALSAEAHRAEHAAKDKARKEQIYQGEWEHK
jgi:hypothetical protein